MALKGNIGWRSTTIVSGAHTTEYSERFGETVQLVVRPHYLNRIHIPKSMRADVVDVSAVDDTSRILLAADVLITDYSSIMFDYLVLDRPVILYAYDYSAYTQSDRGTYFDLREHKPGPLVTSQEEMFSELQKHINGDDDQFEIRSAFREEFAGAEPGNSALSTVNMVWSNR